jgi:hypothetical protein
MASDGAPPDIIIVCGGHTFHAHKDAVCAHSQKLQDACSESTQVRKLLVLRIIHTSEADI